MQVKRTVLTVEWEEKEAERERKSQRCSAGKAGNSWIS